MKMSSTLPTRINIPPSSVALFSAVTYRLTSHIRLPYRSIVGIRMFSLLESEKKLQKNPVVVTKGRRVRVRDDPIRYACFLSLIAYSIF